MAVEYHYVRYSWVDGVDKGFGQLSMSYQDFYLKHNGVGELAFMKLLNSWNASRATNGLNASKAVHKYVYCGFA